VSGAERHLVLRRAPALAGGPLSLLNGALALLAEVRRRGAGWRARLVLDEGLLRADDRKLLVLNAQGSPAKLAGPENGRFDTTGRAALAAAALDAMPPTTEARGVVERLLPPAGADPLEAEVALWRTLLGEAGLEVCGARAGEDAPPADGELGVVPEATWFGPRHLQTLRQFGVAPRLALEGERALKKAFTPPPPVKLAEQLVGLREETEARLAGLEEAIRAEEPRLFGAWCRLRRDLNRGVAGFTKTVERGLRNRDGIRGARLRALAQGLRPYDGPQQDGLGLLTAAALFQLDLERLSEAVDAWADPPDQGIVLVEAASGQRIP
jgi:hypothetical protein